jgi:hypothetical protein
MAQQQLLWIETLLKLAGGLMLAILPLTTARLLGLPAGTSGFWPRLLGIVLIGLAGAAFVEGSAAGSRGLGLAGAVLINLLSAGMLIALLVVDRAAATARGRTTLWALAVLLLVLSLFELAVA